MTKELKIPLKVEDDIVEADAGSFKASVTIPVEYQKYMKYVKYGLVLLGIALAYAGYTLIMG